MDRLGRDPLDLMSEIEDVLGIDAVPVNWPVGQGSDFIGVYDRIGRARCCSSPAAARDDAGRPGRDRRPARTAKAGPRGRRRESWRRDRRRLPRICSTAPECRVRPIGPRPGRRADADVLRQRTHQLRGLCPSSSVSSRWRPAPGPMRESDAGPIDPVEHPFSGFVFKIQANMDPDHRDRVAFLRICSGRFRQGFANSRSTFARARSCGFRSPPWSRRATVNRSRRPIRATSSGSSIRGSSASVIP